MVDGVALSLVLSEEKSWEGKGGRQRVPSGVGAGWDLRPPVGVCETPRVEGAGRYCSLGK